MNRVAIAVAVLCIAAASASADAGRSWFGLTTHNLEAYTADQEALLYSKADFRGIYVRID